MGLKYAVIGTGALGGYYGGVLAKNEKDVHFLFHSDYKYVKENGLRVDSVNGDFTLSKVNAYNNIKSMPQCDIILVCLKTTNNTLLKELLPPIVHEKSVVVLVQNGLGMEADLQKEFPDLAIAGAMAFICSNKIGEGHIAHLDQGSLNVGSYSVCDTNILHQVCEDFNKSGVVANLVDLESARWKKLVWNIPYNGMTVVLNTTTDRLMKNPASRQLIYELMQEVILAANKVGEGRFVISEDFADKMMETTDRMTPYSPSMKLDYDNLRPLEIEYIYSKVLEAASDVNCKMYFTSTLEKQLRFIEEGYLNER